MQVKTIIAIFLINIFILERVVFLHSLTIFPQRVNVTYINKKHIEYAYLYSKRWGRKSPYFLNLEAKKYYPWGNNASFHLVFYEYLHNEYRRSFVEWHLKLCELLENDVLIGQMIKRFNYKCPIVEQEVRMVNVTPPTQFPYKFPFEQFRIEAIMDHTHTGELLAKAELYMIMKE